MIRIDNLHIIKHFQDNSLFIIQQSIKSTLKNLKDHRQIYIRTYMLKKSVQKSKLNVS